MTDGMDSINIEETMWEMADKIHYLTEEIIKMRAERNYYKARVDAYERWCADNGVIIDPPPGLMPEKVPDDL